MIVSAFNLPTALSLSVLQWVHLRETPVEEVVRMAHEKDLHQKAIQPIDFDKLCRGVRGICIYMYIYISPDPPSRLSQEVQFHHKFNQSQINCYLSLTCNQYRFAFRDLVCFHIEKKINQNKSGLRQTKNGTNERTNEQKRNNVSAGRLGDWAAIKDHLRFMVDTYIVLRNGCYKVLLRTGMSV